MKSNICIKKYKFKFFTFHDASFSMSRKQGYEFCDEISSRGLNNNMKWSVACRVDLVKEDLLREMKKSGLYSIMYGFESGNQKVLDSVGKHITLEQMHRAVRATKKKAGFSLRELLL